MARNTLIMVDIDSTLYDAVSAFAEAATLKGCTWPVDAGFWLRAKDLNITGKTLSQIFDYVHSHEVVENLEPYPDCKHVLLGVVHNYPVDVWYVSNRSVDKREPLENWLLSHRFPQPHHVHVSKDKKEWMRRYKPDFVIDDRVKTLIFAKQEINSICMSLIHPWNINLSNEEVEGIYLFDTWYYMGLKLDEMLQEWHNGKI